MDTLELLYLKSIENGKVAKALNDKLQTEVDKNDLIEAIEGIDVRAIVQATVKKNAVFKNITNSADSIANNLYNNNVLIESLDFPNALTIGSYAMYNCISLSDINLPSAVTISDNAMHSCISLSRINLPNVTSIGRSVFLNCVSLISLNLTSAVIIDAGSLTSCISLQSLELPMATSIGSNAMQNCISLTTLKLGASEVATLSNANTLSNTPIAKGTGYIYVPDSLVDSYKTATNWSAYADQIRPMSECEVE